MPNHKDLTGADLHEPKGISTASANTGYFANGAGSGTWTKVGKNQIDTSSILNINKFKQTAFVADISTAETILIPQVVASRLTLVTIIINGAITGADSTLSIYKNSATTIGTLTVSYTGSGEGSTFTFTPVSNNTFSAGEYLKIVNDGASTGTQKATIVLDFDYV